MMAMRLQISFELLIYLTLAGLSTVFALAVLAARWPGIVKSIDSYSVSSFVSSVNGKIAAGATAFSLYVPPGLCNSTIVGDEIRTEYGTYYLDSAASAESGIFCPGGAVSGFTVTYSGSGEWVLSK